MSLKKFTLGIILLLVIATISTSLKAQAWQWAKQASSTNMLYTRCVDVDASGNSYITGEFFNSLTLGSVTLSNPLMYGIFIAKYDAVGNIVWAKIAAAAGDIYAGGICVDNTGNIVITGRYSDAAKFGSGATVLTATGSFDVFVAKYDANGELKWAKSSGDAGYDAGNSVSTDDKGNVHVTGEFHISSFQGSAAKIFVTKYDNAGNVSWSIQATDHGNFHFSNDIKTDNSGSSYITGNFFSKLSFDGNKTITTGHPESEAFVGKIDKDGKVVWLQKAGAASGYVISNGIDIDAAGNSFIIGYYRGNVNFQSLTMPVPDGIYDSYVAKCDKDGNFVWLRNISGPGDADKGGRISVTPVGECYAAGYFVGSVTAGSSTLTGKGQTDIYIAKLNAGGNVIWAAQCGGNLADVIGGIKVKGGGVYILGEFTSKIDFSSNISLLSSSTKNELFIAKIQDAAAAISNIENEGEHVYIFPNPAEDYIELSASDNFKSYFICDITGKTVSRGIMDSTNKIAIPGLQAGVYYLQLIKDNEAAKFNIKFSKL